MHNDGVQSGAAGGRVETLTVPAGGRLGGHIPILDGIRGLAIGLVMLFHFTVLHTQTPADRVWTTVFGLGWMGVDLFFVLSGFLITGILYDAKGSEGFFRNFYARRTLRIFPLYYAVVLACLVVLPYLLPAAAEAAGSPRIAEVIREKMGRLEGIQGHELWFWLYLSNVPMALEGTYLHSILGVSWSLAIEEQFYMVWPAVVFFCPRRRLLRVCLWMFGLALAWRLALTGYFLVRPWEGRAVAVYVSSFSRMDALVTGAFLALVARRAGGVDLAAWARRARPVAAACLVAVVAIAVAELRVGNYDTVHHPPGHGPVFQTLGLTLVSVLFGSLMVMVLASSPGSGPLGAALHALFMSAPLRTLGKYAYALYLFHQPMKALVRDLVFGPTASAKVPFFQVAGSQIPGQIAFYALLFPLCLGAAVVSWYVFELQFLKLKRFFPTGKRPRAGLESGLAGVPPQAPAAEAAGLATPR